MSLESPLSHARTQLQAERDAFTARSTAIETFISQVSRLSPDSSVSSSVEMRMPSKANPVAGPSGSEGCQTVRTAFAETLRPHSIADVDKSEPLLETIRIELSDEIALALAPTTETTFSSTLQQAILTKASQRLTEAEAMQQTLDQEASFLEQATETVDTVSAWLASAGETHIAMLSFPTLQNRHESLESYRTRCDELVRSRQSFLQDTTCQHSVATRQHDTFVSYLYEDLNVTYPVLATIARLDAICRAYQWAVRTHLTRRV
ncbi:hypothetical protein SAMN04487948_11120 [Halogranum amylolyticum]|uniref:DUF7260 domain-containing protein n=1 Tax=Halogranum amylolyticum TaxID=660520 RepID=A0A1H8UGU5_9EURY|nr:hypothetical protein SAMN04487948_11120 [Halogranum amylolyticum]